ncbi:adenylate/guanylate cyclase domain-containing protein [Candidatus Nitrosocosmicus arcticus]|uniref:Adenylate cyclase, family 3 n=1 Tax=Candidatus Nitrosocosmicus arcticus TaxID=2035267 RepID=A0A557SRZ1_9ARCH|nr:adenylate/guanylate cyclase domain-containing protein [Candidatus Nitrosocosmicus arcticus]TVP39374.1 Adenylate cyclase, family 3 [Candidatus Nitrosocosmicus arcticus]
MNLFDSGIPPEIIALQLDIEEVEVEEVIKDLNEKKDHKNNRLIGNKKVDNASVFYVDALIDIQKIITASQSSMWKALRSDPIFTAPFDETQEILSSYYNEKIKLLILNIDIVGSTKLSMNLPIERVSKIIQTFSQEMTKIIRLYGGYVLKYIGDAIIGFFNVSSDHLYTLCINAINCARTMINVINQGFNPVFSQYDYPEIGVRIGIDYGDNVIVKYYPYVENVNDLTRYDYKTIPKTSELISDKEPSYDILGYTISIATKMTTYAKVNHIIVGQLIYDVLSKEEQEYFSVVDINPENWNYISDETGSIYKLYLNRA